MKKQILIPESQADIPLHKYQEFIQKAEKNEEKALEYALDIFLGLDAATQKRMKVSNLDELYAQLGKVLQESHDITLRFKHEGVEYGFIPELESITFGEYMDAEKCLIDPKLWHKFLAVCYRPITKQAGNTYLIEPYEGTKKYEEAMKSAPTSIMTGVSVFFYRLSSVLLSNTQSYSEAQKMMSDTFQPSRNNSAKTGHGQPA